MSKPKWPPIRSYENVKASDDKYNNATKVFSLFTQPIMLLRTNPPPSAECVGRSSVAREALQAWAAIARRREWPALPPFPNNECAVNMALFQHYYCIKITYKVSK